MVLGLKPTRPETGFGYVRLGRREGKVAGHEVFQVDISQKNRRLLSRVATLLRDVISGTAACLSGRLRH